MHIKLKTKGRHSSREDFERAQHNVNVDMMKIIKTSKVPDSGNIQVRCNMHINQFNQPEYSVELIPFDKDETHPETSKVFSVSDFKNYMREH